VLLCSNGADIPAEVLGFGNNALKSPQRNHEERAALGTLVNVDPAFDSLHCDKRFHEIVQRMGLIPSSKGQ
jgi:hypothetical protein